MIPKMLRYMCEDNKPLKMFTSSLILRAFSMLNICAIQFHTPPVIHLELSQPTERLTNRVLTHNPRKVKKALQSRRQRRGGTCINTKELNTSDPILCCPSFRAGPCCWAACAMRLPLQQWRRKQVETSIIIIACALHSKHRQQVA